MAEIFQENTHLAPLDCAVMSLKKFFTETDIPVSFFDELNEPSTADYLNLFTPLRETDYLKGIIITDDLSSFRKALLNRADTRDQIEYVQRLCGKSSQQAMNVAIELVSDMEKKTQYPPEMTLSTTGPELAQRVESLIQAITLKKQETTDNQTT